MSDSQISGKDLRKALEISESQVSNKKPRYEGENSDLIILKKIEGRLKKSTDAITSLVKNENQILIACKNLRETTENNAKGFQKLREKVKDITGKTVIQKMSEGKGTGIHTKNGWFQGTKEEWQVLTHIFKERVLIGNTTFGDSGMNIEEENVEVMGDIIANQLPSEKEASITELIMKCQKSVENEGEGIYQMMKELEDVYRIIEANKIPTNRKWGCDDVDQCSAKDLEMLTDNFSEENLIGDTTYGKLYKGKLKLDSSGSETRDVVVKVWDDKANYLDDGKVVKEEVKFLAYRSNHRQNLPKLLYFCNDGDCNPKWLNGVVYDINNPLDRLYNCIPKDNFSWIQRVKVAFELATLLQSLHNSDRPYVLFDMDTKNILLNQEYSPLMVDFGLLCGGLKGGPRLSQESGYMPYGFEDPYLHNSYGVRSVWNDVYSYGVILLGLLTKRVDSKEDMVKPDSSLNILTEWASREYNGDGSSLVESRLTEDEDYEVSDGIGLTKLAMDCISGSTDTIVGDFRRNSAFGIVHCLAELDINKRQEFQGMLSP